MFSERPLADGRPNAVLVFNALSADAGRLTQQWLARVRAFDEAGWTTHAVFINKDPQLAATIRTLQADGRLPAALQSHHYAMRDRLVRASWWGPLPQGSTIDPRVGDWLDWLTGQIPGAVVMADSPAAYPYVTHMTNPLVARVAAVHLSHLAPGADPLSGPLAPRFAERFQGHLEAFDAIVCETRAQAEDVRLRFGADLPTTHVAPFLKAATPRARPDAGGAPLTVLSVGALGDPASGHEQVLDALPAVLAEHPGARLRLVGDGDPGGLLARAEALGVADHLDVAAAGGLGRHLAEASVLVWAGAHESWPLNLSRALAAGVPVVAVDTRYGPKEIVTDAALGELVPPEADLSGPIGRALDRWTSAGEPLDQIVRAAAAPVLQALDPREAGARWTALAGGLADAACDHRSTSLLVEALATNGRVLRVRGVLADSARPVTAWACDPGGLPEPAGWLTDPPPAEMVVRDGEPPVHPRAAGPTRPIMATLRWNALALAAAESGRAFRVEFSDGSAVVPLLAMGFEDRIIADRAGTATLHREADGSVWVRPRPELIAAHNFEGRIVVRTAPDAPVSDVTHAVSWSVAVDWADLKATAEGVAFTGVLLARGLVPADDSPPALCVTDVGGFCRVVGRLHYTGEPRVAGVEWSADVTGELDIDPLVATTQLARRALALHVGFPGLLVPIGGVYTQDRRRRLQLESPRGILTLLPSAKGRVLVAPGSGSRARLTAAVRGVVTRG